MGKKEELKIEDFIEYLPYGLEMYNPEIKKKVLLCGIDINSNIQYTYKEVSNPLEIAIYSDVFEVYKPLLNPFTPESMMELAKVHFNAIELGNESIFSKYSSTIFFKTPHNWYEFNYSCKSGSFTVDGKLSLSNKEMLIKARKMHLDLNGLLFKGLAANKKEVDKPKVKQSDLDDYHLVTQLNTTTNNKSDIDIYTASINALNYSIELISESGVTVPDAKEIMIKEIKKMQELSNDIANNK